MYVVKMNGMKVRDFDDIIGARAFIRHCHGNVKIVRMAECKELPRACGKMYPNEDMPGLVYKPFAAVM